MTESLSVQQLTVSYDDNVALQDVSFQLQQGVIAGVMGPNGAGKSTLMKASLDLIPKDSGNIKVNGKPVKEMRTDIAYVPQRNDIDSDFPINVRDTVLLGTYPNLGYFRRPRKAERDLADSCLEQVGLSHYKKQQIGQLSGGQQQRVFLARALAQQAHLFFLDEPFVGIDATSEETIINILKELRNNGSTVVVIHHDLSKAAEYFDEMILINQKLMASGPPEEVLQPEIINKAYNTQPYFQRASGVSM